jgi:HSP20 family protein
MSELISWKEKELDRIRQDIERVFRRSCRDFGLPPVPEAAFRLTAVDLSETENEFVIIAELPEIKPENIDIEVSSNSVTIELKTESEAVRKGEATQSLEHTAAFSSRRFLLPTPVSAEKATASCTANKLKIRLPKQRRSETRRVQIEIG